MALPQKSSKVWSEIVSGAKKVDFEFLAAKIFMGMAAINYKTNPGSLAKLSEDLHNVFEKNQHLPLAQKDIAKLGE